MPIRIGLVDLWNVTGVNGGAERVLCNMANALTHRGFKVYVICCDEAAGVPDFPLSPSVDFRNFGAEPLPFRLRKGIRKIRALRLSRNSRRRARARYWADSLAYKIKKFVSTESIDVYITFQPLATYVLKSKLKVLAPVISMFHGDPNAYVDLTFQTLYRSSMERSEVVQVLIPEYVEEALKVLPRLRPEDVVCIPNAIEGSGRLACLSKKTIIHVARIASAQKRQHLLVDAFAKIHENFPGWKLEFWGDDHYEPEYTAHIKNLIKNYGLDDVVFIRGITHDIEEKLLSASIFALPSKMEGFSMALGEAMALGLPVVGCTDCVSVISVVSSGVSGILTDPTAGSLADGLAQLMSDESLRKHMGNAARLQIAEYSPDAVWDKWDSLIRSLLP